MKYCVDAAAFSLIFMIPFGAARAQNALPNATDLHAAYCIPILKEMATESNEAVARLLMLEKNRPESGAAKAARKKALQGAKEDHSAIDASLKKVQLYLLPRMMRLAPMGLLAASTAAKDDMNRVAKGFKSCSNACVHNTNLYEKCLKVCVRKKIPNMANLWKKWQECKDPAWLPY